MLALKKRLVTLYSWVCHLKYSLFMLALKKRWVTLYSWVCHLKYSLFLLAQKSLGYTVLMGVLPKVQPIYIGSP